MTIFESAVKQLTAWYVSALFIVSLLFSVPTYYIAANHLEGGARRQAEILIQESGPKGHQLPPKLVYLRDQQLHKDRQQLMRTIIFANIAILALGAYFSYWFAKRTLRPIEEAHEAQARFTTDASHELRTPLSTMQAEIEVALRDKKFSVKDAKEVLRSNLEEIDRLRALSEQLLGLARLDSGQLQKNSVQFSKIVSEEINNIEKHRGVIIDQVIEKDLKVHGDKHLLLQLLTILTENAVKYAGDQATKIKIELKKKDNWAQLSVIDHGIGIKASELPHIFDRFYRGSNATKHSANGHGLGLSLAKQIVDAHGGKIIVKSTLGKTTIFEISLPLQ